MNPIDLKPTNTTPAITFNKDKLTITGRSIPLSEAKFYDPFIAWAETLEVDTLTIEIKLEYVNSSSTKKLLHLFKMLDVNHKIRQLFVNWFYEEGDEESKDHGKVFENLMKRAKFRFIRYKDNN